MDLVHKIMKNVSIILVGELVFRLISLLIVISLARHLSIEDFGKYNFVFVYVGLFSIITDLGLGDIIVREMARDTNKMPQIFGNAYIIRIILSFLAILIAIITISLMKYPADTKIYVYIASLILLFQSISETYRTLFRTTLKMEYEIIAKLLFKIVSAILIFYIIAANGTLLQIVFAITFSELLRSLLNYIFSKKIIHIKLSINFIMWKFLLKESLPIALSGIFLVVYNRIDVLMISMMKGDLAVGVYSAAFTLSEPLGLIPYSIIVPLFPVMATSIQHSKERLIKSYEMGFKFIIILMMPIAFGTTLISDKIILLIYGPSYVDSIITLKILIWSLFIVSINYLLTSVLTAINKQKLTTLNMSICVIANVLMNLLLIPLFSYNGAAIATVITQLILLLLNNYYISKYLGNLLMYNKFIKPLIACLVMGLPVYYLNNFSSLNVFIIIAFAATIYWLLLFKLEIFSTEENIIIKKFS